MPIPSRTPTRTSMPSWLPPVADARAELLEQLRPLVSTSRNASYAAQLLPPMLGADGPGKAEAEPAAEPETDEPGLPLPLPDDRRELP